MKKFIVLICLSIIISFVSCDNNQLINANNDLQEKVNQLLEENQVMKLQIQDLYFMTQPLRIRVADQNGGNFYYAVNTGFRYKNKIYSMLPSEVEKANVFYDMVWNKHSAEEEKKLSQKFMFLTEQNKSIYNFKSSYDFWESELKRDIDSGLYQLMTPVGRIE